LKKVGVAVEEQEQLTKNNTKDVKEEKQVLF
jgi:hypothetical protein